MQNGLRKRIETPERYLSVPPIIGGVAKDIEQLLSGLFVKLGVRWNLLEHHDEAGLWAGLVQWIGHAVVQSVEIFAEVRRQRELRSDQVKHILLALSCGQIGKQKMMSQTLGRFLQIAHAKRSNRLDDVCPNTLERCF